MNVHMSNLPILIIAILTCFIVLLLYFQGGGAITVFDGEAVINNCFFLNNTAVTTATGDEDAFGGAIDLFADKEPAKLKVFNSIFKKNKALQAVIDDFVGGGGAISAGTSANDDQADVIVLNSVFELNEASNIVGAVQFVKFDSAGTLSVKWINNKELLLGNDAEEGCDGGAKLDLDDEVLVCFNVEDYFSEEILPDSA